MHQENAVRATELCQAYDQPLRSFIARRTACLPDPAESVEDLMQQLRWRVWSQFEPARHPQPDSGRSLLFRTAKSVALNALKRRSADKRRPQTATDGRQPARRRRRRPPPIGFCAQSPFEHACSAEQCRLVQDAIRRLPAEYQKVIELCDLAEYTLADAAPLLNRSEEAVRKLRARAWRALRRLLAPIADDLDER